MSISDSIKSISDSFRSISDSFRSISDCLGLFQIQGLLWESVHTRLDRSQTRLNCSQFALSVHIQIVFHLDRFLRKCSHSFRSISDSFRSISDSFRSISVRIRAFTSDRFRLRSIYVTIVNDRLLLLSPCILAKVKTNQQQRLCRVSRKWGLRQQTRPILLHWRRENVTVVASCCLKHIKICSPFAQRSCLRLHRWDMHWQSRGERKYTTGLASAASTGLASTGLASTTLLQLNNIYVY